MKGVHLWGRGRLLKVVCHDRWSLMAGDRMLACLRRWPNIKTALCEPSADTAVKAS